MKISTNKTELEELEACSEGYELFIKSHDDNEVTFSQYLDSNGWSDAWWLLERVENQMSVEQKHDLRLYSCSIALINIEKIKPYCPVDDYKTIVSYLNSPQSETRLEAQAAAAQASWTAASAAWSARSAAESAESAAMESVVAAAVWSLAAAMESVVAAAVWSTAVESLAAWSSARSAAESANINSLRELFLKWESKV